MGITDGLVLPDVSDNLDRFIRNAKNHQPQKSLIRKGFPKYGLVNNPDSERFGEKKNSYGMFGSRQDTGPRLDFFSLYPSLHPSATPSRGTYGGHNQEDSIFFRSIPSSERRRRVLPYALSSYRSADFDGDEANIFIPWQESRESMIDAAIRTTQREYVMRRAGAARTLYIPFIGRTIRTTWRRRRVGGKRKMRVTKTEFAPNDDVYDKNIKLWKLFLRHRLNDKCDTRQELLIKLKDIISLQKSVQLAICKKWENVYSKLQRKKSLSESKLSPKNAKSKIGYINDINMFPSKDMYHYSVMIPQNV